MKSSDNISVYFLHLFGIFVLSFWDEGEMGELGV